MSLAQRSVRSSSYTFIASGITTVVQFIRSILLARLIAPEIFGIYTFAASIVLFTSSLPSFGMSSALLHRVPESEGEEPLRVHFTIMFVFNTIWAIIIIFIGTFAFPNEFRWVLWVILATQFTDNLVETSRTLLIRRVIFRRIALVDTLSVVLSTVCALILATKGFGIHGLITTDVVSAVIAVLGYLVIRPPWKPRFGWSAKTARYLLNFGKRAFLANLLGQALNYLDNIWAGQFLGKSALGYYSRAYTFSSYPRKVLATPLNSVAAGTYAELKGDQKNLSRAFFRVNAILVRAGFLMAGLLALIAPEFIYLVIGEQWLPMLDAFRLMLLFTLLDPIQLTIASLFYAVGRPEQVLRSRLLQFGMLIGGMFIFGNLWGISGVAIALNLMVLSGIITMLWKARAYVQFSLIRLFSVPTLGLVIGIGLARLGIEIPGILGSPWRTASVKIVIFTIVYLTIVLILERKYIKIFVDMVLKIIPNYDLHSKKPT